MFRRKGKLSRIKRILLIAIPILLLILILFNMMLDDELFYYYMNRDNSVSINENESNVRNRHVYYAGDKIKKKKGNRVIGENGAIDASLEEILDALREILGEFGPEYFKEGTRMTDQQASFLADYVPDFISAHLKYPEIFTTTFILVKVEESGWTMTGSSKITNNMYGIKASGPATPYWTPGNSQSLDTSEGEGEGKYSTTAAFRTYPNVTYSILDFAEFLKTNERYTVGGSPYAFGLYGDDANAFKATSSVDQITRLQNSGYSTSPNKYVADVTAIFDFCNMQRIDDLADKVYDILVDTGGDGDYPEEEWRPEGDSTWIDKVESDFGITIDTSKTSSIVGGVLEEAVKHLGSKYVYGAKGPDVFDCSGYVGYCFQKVAKETNLQHTSLLLKSDRFTDVTDWNDVRPGDIFVYDMDGGKRAHTGFIIGKDPDGVKGHFIILHAPYTGTVIQFGKYNFQNKLNEAGPDRAKVRRYKG